jgi:outer membrane protein assembly factor BamB
LRVAALGVVLSLTASGCWLQHGFNAGRNRYIAGDTTITTADADQLVELWRATGLGAGVNEPVVFGDDVYVTTGVGTVSRLSASTGEVRYTRTLTSPDDGLGIGLLPPIYQDGELVAGWSGTRSSATLRPGGVAHLVPATGELAQPLVSGFYTGTDFADDGGLVTQADSFDFSTGMAIGEAYVDWRGIRASVGLQFGGYTFSDFALAGDHLVWEAGSSAVGWNGTPCATPGHLAGDGSAYCPPDWTTSLPGSLSGPAALGSDAAVYGVAGQTSQIAVLDAATGGVRFTATVPNHSFFSLTPPTVAGDTILIGTGLGELMAFSAAGCGQAACAPLWRATVGPVYNAPTVVGDVAYVVTDDGHLVTLALHGCGAATCSPIASYPLNAGTASVGQPAVYESGRILVTTGDGQLVAFGLPAP